MDLNGVKQGWESTYFREDIEKRYQPIYGNFFYKRLKNLKGNVLDVGCGPFHCWSEDAKERNYDNLIGLDFSKRALKRTKGRKINIGNFHPILGAAQYLPFQSNSFDTVVCIETLSFTGDYYKQVLQELKRVAKKDIVLTFTHKEYAKNYVEKGLISIDDNIIVKNNSVRDAAVFNEDDVRRDLKELGLRIKEMRSFAWEEIGEKVSDIDPQSKKAIYVVCEKT